VYIVMVIGHGLAQHCFFHSEVCKHVYNRFRFLPSDVYTDVCAEFFCGFFPLRRMVSCSLIIGLHFLGGLNRRIPPGLPRPMFNICRDACGP